MASAFSLLTAGGARFDKSRFKQDIDLFGGVSSSELLSMFCFSVQARVWRQL